MLFSNKTFVADKKEVKIAGKERGRGKRKDGEKGKEEEAEKKMSPNFGLCACLKVKYCSLRYRLTKQKSR